MPKHSSDVRGRLTAVLRAALNGAGTLYVITLDASFLPCESIDTQLFTGLDCSCFGQIYCTSLLVDMSCFPVEK